MSDTPRTDGVYPPDLLARGIEIHGNTWGWGELQKMRDHARTLERELTAAIKERDSAIDSADNAIEIARKVDAKERDDLKRALASSVLMQDIGQKARDALRAEVERLREGKQ